MVHTAWAREARVGTTYLVRWRTTGYPHWVNLPAHSQGCVRHLHLIVASPKFTLLEPSFFP